MRKTKKEFKQIVKYRKYQNIFLDKIDKRIDLGNNKIFWLNFFTDTEMHAFNLRYATIQMLLEGHSYTKIKEVLNVSSATIARVSKKIQYYEY